MNPYALTRKTFTIIGHVLKWLMILTTVFLSGVIGVSITGGNPWGWVLGPVAAAIVSVLLLLVIFTGVHLPFWWQKKERLYREKQQTAHVESTPVTN